MHFSPFDYEQSWTPQQFIKVEIILKYLVVFRLGWSNAWGVVVGEKARNFHSCFKHSPAAFFPVSSQGMKSGKDSQIPGPALIKLPGFHSRTHMVSETVLSSSLFCRLFCFEGQRAALSSFLFLPLCGDHYICGRQVSAPLKQEQRD